MKFYVASKWDNRLEVRKLYKILIHLEHTITVDWTWHEKDDSDYPSGYAIEDIEGVVEADAYVGLFFNDCNYKGALVEMGASLGLGKPTYIIGHAIDSCLFVFHPLVRQFETITHFIEYIRRIP